MNEPLVSYRAWRLTARWKAVIEDNLLHPLCVQTDVAKHYELNAMWEPGKPTKKIHIEHGIYSWKKLSNAATYMRRMTRLLEKFETPDCCFGEIYSWGKIEEYQFGYQSEFAYPKKLYILNDTKLSQNLQRKYGCEVENIEMENWDEYLISCNYNVHDAGVK